MIIEDVAFFDSYIKRLCKTLNDFEQTNDDRTALLIQKVVDGMLSSKNDFLNGTISYDEAFKEIKTLYYFIQTIIALRGHNDENVNELLDKDTAR